MTTVRDVMTTDPIVLATTTRVHDAARRMRESDVGDVLVEEGGTLRGIVTDRDIVVRAIAEGMDPDATTIGDCCTSELFTLEPDADADEAVQMMREHAVRRIPVVDDGTAVGIVTMGDLAVQRDERSALADISAKPGNA